jgi:magnesium transporter
MPSLPSFSGLRGRSARGNGRVTPPVPVPLSAYVVDCGVYIDGKRLPGRWTHTDAVREVRKRREGFVWIGLYEPDEEQIQGVADTFGLHELAVEDAVQAHQRPKLERYDDTLFMVLKTVHYIEHDSPGTANEIVETGELMVFLGKDFVVTVAIEDDIDEMEVQVFAPRTAVDSEQIYLMKREVLELRRAVMPLAVPLRRLSEGYITLVPEEVRSYFRDVEDHLTTVSEHIASFDELLSTLIDAALAKITLQQNTDMRKITAWAAIISVPTMIAGIYGMNFEDMPELHWRFGYPIIIGVIILSCLLLYRILRRNRWL